MNSLLSGDNQRGEHDMITIRVVDIIIIEERGASSGRRVPQPNPERI